MQIQGWRRWAPVMVVALLDEVSESVSLETNVISAGQQRGHVIQTASVSHGIGDHAGLRICNRNRDTWYHCPRSCR
jgi:hypothetical protein